VRYRDRADAGSRLADAIVAAQVIGSDEHPLVLGVPRGGVPVAVAVAERLGADVDVLVAHKLGAPGNPEFAVGAVAEDGTLVVDRDLLNRLGIRDDYIDAEGARQAAEVKRRAQSYRHGTEAVPVADRICLVVDDGVATGSTLEAAIALVKRRGAARVIVAVPVGPVESIERLGRTADEVVCPLQPEPCFAVGGWYDRFDQVSDAQVMRFLDTPA
jgi:predicted phosphoribosyltransferase